MSMIPRLAVLLSGSGSTLQNLIDRVADRRLRATIVGVVSSRADVLGVERAKKAGLPVAVDKQAPFDIVRDWRPDFVVLAGWIHLLTLPPDFACKVVNVHPSLLPAFGGKGMYGLNVHRAVLASGARVSGCTVHFADDTYDTGPIVHQATVPVADTDTPESLAERVQAAEREAYPEALAKLAGGGWRVVGRRVVWG